MLSILCCGDFLALRETFICVLVELRLSLSLPYEIAGGELLTFDTSNISVKYRTLLLISKLNVGIVC